MRFGKNSSQYAQTVRGQVCLTVFAQVVGITEVEKS
jgi:hypothetical protein